MGLRDLLGSVQKDIVCGDISFTVKPISLDGVGELLEASPEAINSLLKGDLQVNEILSKAPEFGARFIKAGLVEDLSFEEIKTLPMGVQFAALEGIWDISYLDMEKLGKSLRRFTSAMKGSVEQPEIPTKT